MFLLNNSFFLQFHTYSFSKFLSSSWFFWVIIINIIVFGEDKLRDFRFYVKLEPFFYLLNSADFQSVFFFHVVDYLINLRHRTKFKCKTTSKYKCFSNKKQIQNLLTFAIFLWITFSMHMAHTPHPIICPMPRIQTAVS